MTFPLISILTPSFNCGDIIHRLLDSVLEQTYPNVEMYVIDDGSTDDTQIIVESYIPLFEKRKYTLSYIYQENAGQSVAINNGLKLIKGSYLVWPDSDDYYASPRALEILINVFLTENRKSDIGLVRCEANLLDSQTLQYVGKLGLNARKKQSEYLFEDCLFAKNGYWFLAGGYMADLRLVDKYIVGREIYTEKITGQNWQLMLPLLYENRCVTVKESLYNVLVRMESHSRGTSYKELLCKVQSYERTISGTLERMNCIPVKKKKKYKAALYMKYVYEQMNLAVLFDRKEEMRQLYSELKRNRHQRKHISLRDRIKYFVLLDCHSFYSLFINLKKSFFHG
ncbi:glycosyltransferase family A protein [uncultured Bacteroides sp.]|jgi:glycosyltransferase involved in cell wall biosynthesis|uniref:glycosyltransferase family A protein n=1 Tax=uncultured Bacteroides sp. TaxID=162156 RepID=UPI00258E9FF6|nr:glycosyltransferase family A protein [uncultured Bacteroides sp.]